MVKKKIGILNNSSKIMKTKKHFSKPQLFDLWKYFHNGEVF